jgi:hypothetical protein
VHIWPRVDRLARLPAAGSNCPATSGTVPAGRRQGKEIGMGRLIAAMRRSDDGMSTAEYAVGTVAACGFGALLFKILTSGFASSLLENLISHALHLGL